MGRWASDDDTASSNVRAAGTPNVTVNVTPTPAPPRSLFRTLFWCAAIGAGLYWVAPLIRHFYRHGSIPAPPLPPRLGDYGPEHAQHVHVHVHASELVHEPPARTETEPEAE